MNDFLLSSEGRNYLLSEYVQKERSTYDLATENKTYANRIRRALRYHEIPLRDKKDAQKAALKSGRHAHPTEGTHRPPEVKLLISHGISQVWKNMDATERTRRVALAKAQWERMEPEERERLCKLASDGVRRAARDGSKLEQYLLVNLKACGYKADFHKEYLISAEQMHVDIFLPHLKVAIEVDGPTHFLPIWGEEHLEKRIEEDNRKTGLLLQSGYVVIRIKHMVKTLSDRMKRETFERLRHELEQISEAFPANERVIELEVK